MKKVKVFVTLKPGVLDPQGKASAEALHSLGYEEVKEVRIGKVIELQIEDGPNLEERVKEMADKLLVNPAMEIYEFQVEEATKA